MAHQAILAAAERRRQVVAEAGGFMRKKKNFAGKKSDLRQALALQMDRLDSLFPIWDVDGDGTISKKEFKRALRLMGVSATDAQMNAFCELCDEDGSGDLDLSELKRVLAATELPKPPPAPPKPLYLRFLSSSLEFLNTTAIQSFLYFAVVLIFQLLIDTVRLPRRIPNFPFLLLVALASPNVRRARTACKEHNLPPRACTSRAAATVRHMPHPRYPAPVTRPRRSSPRSFELAPRCSSTSAFTRRS